MTQLTPPAGEHWRLRPRDGNARAVVEHVSQNMWKWRVEATLAYIAAALTAVLLYSTGLL